jgi:hypothetical protein
VVSAYERWRAATFPEPSSTDDEVDDIRSDLIYWDAMVADIVIPAVQRGVAYDSGVLDLDGGLSALAEKISAALARTSGTGLVDLRSYAAYLDLLVATNQEALRRA